MGLDIPMTMAPHLFLAFAAGAIGAAIVAVILFGLQAVGQGFDAPYVIGTYFVDAAEKAKVYTIGIILEIVIGGIWGMLFVTTMMGLSIEPAWGAGILWGFAIGIIVGVIMSTITQSHPIMGEDKEISDPGILGSEWSNAIPYIILGVHVIFGVVTLYTYREIFGVVIQFP